jgi:hypothetical protein
LDGCSVTRHTQDHKSNLPAKHVGRIAQLTFSIAA